MESIGLVTVQDDFEDNETYRKLSQDDKNLVWEYAQSKFIDILMQDYYLCLDACVEGALSMKALKEDLK